MGVRASSLEDIVRDAELPDGPTADAFEAYLCERFPADDETRVLADLYVAFACASGSRKAAEVIGKQVLAVRVGSRTLRVPQDTIDEARQIVFERLVGDVASATPMKIRSYDGRGPLGAWLRVVVAREALYRHKQRTQVPDGPIEELVALAAPDDDPELAGMKTELRAKYRAALQHAVRLLTSRERALLRQHFVLGMSVDALAPVYGIHRATVARWITAANERLLDGFYLELRETTGLRRQEAEKLRTLVHSRLDLSLASLLESKA